MNCVDLEEGEQKAPAMFSKSFWLIGDVVEWTKNQTTGVLRLAPVLCNIAKL